MSVRYFVQFSVKVFGRKKGVRVIRTDTVPCDRSLITGSKWKLRSIRAHLFHSSYLYNNFRVNVLFLKTYKTHKHYWRSKVDHSKEFWNSFYIVHTHFVNARCLIKRNSEKLMDNLSGNNIKDCSHTSTGKFIIQLFYLCKIILLYVLWTNFLTRYLIPDFL